MNNNIKNNNNTNLDKMNNNDVKCELSKYPKSRDYYEIFYNNDKNNKNTDNKKHSHHYTYNNSNTKNMK
jgi:hypothetical protein